MLSYALEEMGTPHETASLRVRLLVFIGLVVVAVLALPISAAAVEAVSVHAENWILGLYLALVVAVSATIGVLAPKSSSAPTRYGRALRWAGAGLFAAFIGYSAWLLLLAG